jgi:Domain of unknown function (DUF3291)
MQEWHLAQLNVARAVASLDAPELAEFVAALGSINALAEAAPGFVWRLAGADAGAPAAQAHMVLWWIPAGHRPSLSEALERLELLRREGPSVQAFTFKQRFPSPGSDGSVEGLRPEPHCSGWE